MDVNAIAAVATEMSQAKTADAVSFAVLKKAIDLQTQGAAQLVQAAIQSARPTSNSTNPGSQVDTFA
jgi:hypothetical protein